MGITVDVQAKTEDAERSLQNIDRTVGRIDQTAQKASSSIAVMAKGIALLAAGGSILKQVTSISSEFKRMGNRIAIVTGRNEQMLTVQKELFKVAARTRAQLETTIDTYGILGRSLARENVSQKNLLKVTEAIQQSVAISGADAMSARSAIVQFGQGLSSGTLRGQELIAVMEQIPTLALAIADGMGVTMGELRNIAAEGELISSRVFESIVDQSKRIADEFSRIAPTVDEGGAKLKDSVKLWINEFANGLRITESIGTQFADWAKFIRDSADNAYLLGNRLNLIYHQVRRIFEPLIKAIVGIGKAVGFSLVNTFIAVINALDDLRRPLNSLLDRIGESIKRTFRLTLGESFKLSFDTAMFAGKHGELGLKLYFWKNTILNILADIKKKINEAFTLSEVEKAMLKNMDMAPLALRIKAELIRIKDIIKAFFKDLFTLDDTQNAFIDLNVSPVIIKMKSQMKELIETVRRPLQSILQWFVRLFDDIVGTANLQGVVSSFVNFGMAIIAVFKDIWYEVIGGSSWTDLMGSLVSTSSITVGLVLRTFGELFSKLSGLFTNLLNVLFNLTSAIYYLFDAMQHRIEGMFHPKFVKGDFEKAAKESMQTAAVYFRDAKVHMASSSQKIFAALALAIKASLSVLILSLKGIIVFKEAVVESFKYIYEKVIGHSYWTDMMTVIAVTTTFILYSVLPKWALFGSTIVGAFAAVALAVVALLPVIAHNFMMIGEYMTAQLEEGSIKSIIRPEAIRSLERYTREILGIIGGMSLAVLGYVVLMQKGIISTFLGLQWGLGGLVLFSISVIALFADIYDKVIGHSYWTDLIHAIVVSSQLLWDLTKEGFYRFQRGTYDIFSSMAEGVEASMPMFDKFFDTLSERFSDALNPPSRSSLLKELFAQQYEKAGLEVPTQFQTQQKWTRRTRKDKPGITQEIPLLNFTDKDTLRASLAVLGKSVKEVLETAADAFGHSMTAVFTGLASLLALALIPASFVRSLLTSTLTAVAVTSADKFADDIGLEFKDGSSLSREVGITVGRWAAEFAKGLLKGLPDFTRGMGHAATTFVSEMVGGIPIIGPIITGIFKTLNFIGFSGPLGLIVTLLLGRYGLKTLAFLWVLKGLLWKIGGQLRFLAGGTSGSVSSKFAKEGIIGSRLFGLAGGWSPIIAAIGGIYSALGGFDEFIGDSFVKYALVNGGLIGLFIWGNKGVNFLLGQLARVGGAVTDNIIGRWGKRDVTNGAGFDITDFDSPSGKGSRAAQLKELVIDKGKQFQLFISRTAGDLWDGFVKFAKKAFKWTFSSLKTLWPKIVQGWLWTVVAAEGLWTRLAFFIETRTAMLSTWLTAKGGVRGAIGNFLMGRNGRYLIVGIVGIMTALFSGIVLAASKSADDMDRGYFQRMKDGFTDLGKGDFTFGNLDLGLTAGFIASLIFFRKAVWNTFKALFTANATKSIGAGIARGIGFGMLSVGLLFAVRDMIDAIRSDGAVEGIMSVYGAEVGLIFILAFARPIKAILARVAAWIAATISIGAAIALGVTGAIIGTLGILYYMFFGKGGKTEKAVDSIINKLKFMSGMRIEPIKIADKDITSNLSQFAKEYNFDLKEFQEQVSLVNPEKLTNKEQTYFNKEVKEFQDAMERFQEKAASSPTGSLSDNDVSELESNVYRIRRIVNDHISKTRASFNDFLEIGRVGLKGNDVFGRLLPDVKEAEGNLNLWEKIMKRGRELTINDRSRTLAKPGVLQAFNDEMDVTINKAKLFKDFVPSAIELRAFRNAKRFNEIGIVDYKLAKKIDTLTKQYVDAKVRYNRNVEKYGNPAENFGLEQIQQLAEQIAEATQEAIDAEAMRQAVKTFNTTLSGIKSGFDKADITFEADKLLGAVSNTFKELEALSKKAKVLDLQKEKVTSLHDYLGVLNKIKEVQKRVNIETTLAANGREGPRNDELVSLFKENGVDIFLSEQDALEIEEGLARRIAEILTNASAAAQKSFLLDQNGQTNPAIRALVNAKNAEAISRATIMAGQGAIVKPESQKAMAEKYGMNWESMLNVHGIKGTFDIIANMTNNIAQLKRASDRGSFVDVRSISEDIRRLKVIADRTMISLDDLASRISGGEYQFELSDLARMSPETLESVRQLGFEYQQIEEQIQIVGDAWDKVALDKIVQRQMVAAKKSLEAFIKIMASTPKRLSEIFSQFNLSDNAKISRLSDPNAKKFADLQERRLRLEFEKTQTNGRPLQEISADLAEVDEEGKKVLATVDNITDVIDKINKAYDLNIDETQYAFLSEPIQISLAADAKEFFRVLELLQNQEPTAINLLALQTHKQAGAVKGASLRGEISNADYKRDITAGVTASSETMAKYIADTFSELSPVEGALATRSMDQLRPLYDKAAEQNRLMREFLGNRSGANRTAVVQGQEAGTLAGFQQADMAQYRIGTKGAVEGIGESIKDGSENYISDMRAKVLLGLRAQLAAKRVELTLAEESGRALVQSQIATLEYAIADEAALATENIVDLSREAGLSFSDSITQGFNESVKELVKGKKKRKEFLKDIMNSVTNNIIDTFIDGLLNPITGKNGVITKALTGLGGALFSSGDAIGKDSGISNAEPVVGAINKATESIQQGTVTQTGALQFLGSFIVGGLNTVGGLIVAALSGLNTLSTMFGGGGGGGGASFLSEIAGVAWGAFGTGPRKLAVGGPVSGPGTNTSDSILARLSNEEFVVNAKAAKANFGILTAINEGRLKGFSEGGMVGNTILEVPSLQAANDNVPSVSNIRNEQVFNIAITGDISKQTRSEIMTMLPQIAGGVNRYNHETLRR